jgi:hypothetical protein
MELSAEERVVLQRYYEKARNAGGPRTGFVLRQDSIRYAEAERAAGDLGVGLDSLLERGLLSASEDRRFFFLTESGVALLTEWR